MIKTRLYILPLLCLLFFSGPAFGQIDLNSSAGVSFEDLKVKEYDSNTASERDLYGTALASKASDYNIAVRTYSRLKDVR